jgi:hypothetical protein
MESGRALYFSLCSLLGSSPDLGGIKAIKLNSEELFAWPAQPAKGSLGKNGDKGIFGKIVILNLSSSE